MQKETISTLLFASFSFDCFPKYMVFVKLVKVA